MCVFPDAGRADQEHVGRGVDVAAGAQLGQQRRVDPGRSVQVEVVQGGTGGQVREPETTSKAPGVGRGDLDPQELLECLGQRPTFRGRLIEHGREGVGGVGEFQVDEVVP